MATRTGAPPLHRLTASEIVQAIRSGDATCEAVARSCLERIAERDGDVQAWQYVDPDQAIAAARAMDRETRRGPLYGVPFNVKDIIDTSDMPTEYGSPIYAGFRPRADAACVALSRKAGAVLLGKAVTVEFANRHPSKTRNPLDLARTPGGSSSGSAASVADYMVPVSIGSQGTSSTVKPASYCGVFGYRPTWGELRCAGVKEASSSFDTLGLFARSIDDIALHRDVLLGAEPTPLTKRASAPRIAFCRTHFWDLLEPSTRTLLEGAADQLRRAGAAVEDLDLPSVFEEAAEARGLIAGFEFALNYTWEIEHHWDRLSETLRNGRIRDGVSCTYDDYVQARSVVEHCRALIAQLLEPYDAVLAAPGTGEAPIGFSTTGSSKPALIWTTMHLPAISIPVFRGPAGLPVGALVVGKRSRDRELLAAADWIYRALG
ncbi:MAG TPA: amidase [Burkholderiales bacterium]|nr:amidase [Burkholderiales bacterium]